MFMEFIQPGAYTKQWLSATMLRSERYIRIKTSTDTVTSGVPVQGGIMKNFEVSTVLITYLLS